MRNIKHNLNQINQELTHWSLSMSADGEGDG